MTPVTRRGINSTASSRLGSTTQRTGLTEIQLREISTVMGRSGSSVANSEVTNKRKRLDNVLEKSNDVLSNIEVRSNSGNENFFNILMLQSSQREARAEDWRREDMLREQKREDEINRRKDAAAEREENRKREQEDRDDIRRRENEEREDRRRREDLDREERREKADKERTEMMLFIFKKDK